MCDSPNKVYKYLNAKRTRDVLAKLQIRFSQASALNDATEFRPPALGLGDNKTVLSAARSRLEERFPGLVAAYRNLYGDEEAEKMMAEILEKNAKGAGGDFEKTRDRIYRQLDENFGVLSLSESPVERLMWSNYGDGERGYLLEFDAGHPWFDQRSGTDDSFRHLRPVVYSSSRSPKNVFDLSDEDALYSKHSDYSWEKEQRLILNFNDATANIGKDDYGIDVLLFSIPPDCLTGIVIGPRADPAFTRSLKNLVGGNPDLSHVIFKKAVRVADSITLLSDDDNTTK